MSCVGFSTSIPKAANGLGSSSSLCLGNPKLLNSGGGRVSIVSVNGGRRRNRGFTCNALFGLGVPELVVIAGVAALVFGPKKLPEVGRSIGKTVKSFQQVIIFPFFSFTINHFKLQHFYIRFWDLLDLNSNSTVSVVVNLGCFNHWYQITYEHSNLLIFYT